MAVNRAVLMALRDAAPECLRDEMPNRRQALTRRKLVSGRRPTAPEAGLAPLPRLPRKMRVEQL